MASSEPAVTVVEPKLGISAGWACPYPASGAPPASLHAAIFPHIRSCCFEVGEDVASEIAAASDAQEVIVGGHDRPHVDLCRVVQAQLADGGVGAGQVEVLEGCTRCDQERFFSYRRDGQRSGRHIAAIVAR